MHHDLKHEIHITEGFFLAQKELEEKGKGEGGRVCFKKIISVFIIYFQIFP